MVFGPFFIQCIYTYRIYKRVYLSSTQTEKVRLSEGCRPTSALRYANADSGKLVNWTTGAYGWLENRRSIYQTSNSAKQLYKTSSSFHRLTCTASMLGGVRFRKWAEVGHVAFHHFLAFSTPRNKTTATFHSSTSIIPMTTMYDVSPSSCRTPDGPPSCVWHSGNNRERASRHSRLTLWLCPFQGIYQLTFPLIFQRWSGTGATTKFRDPVALKGTVWRGRKRFATMRRSEFFLLFPPGPFKGPRTRHGCGLTHFAAEIGNVSPHSRANFLSCFAVWILKSPFITLFYKGSHFILGVTVPIKTCWLCGWQTELVYHPHLVATSL